MSHVPCVPSASCQPARCHPTPPPCQNPEKCFKNTQSKKIRPCLSAVAILKTRSKSRCASCGKFSGTSDPRNNCKVKKFLRRKSKETRLKRRDRIYGTHSYLKYTRRKGSPRKSTDCCAGHGHRGRLKRTNKQRFARCCRICWCGICCCRCRCCEIL